MCMRLRKMEHSGGSSCMAGHRHCCFHPTLPLLYACYEQGSNITSYHSDTISDRLTEKESVSLIPAGYDGATGCTQIRITRNAR